MGRRKLRKEGETCGDWLAKYLEDQGRGDEEINMVTIQGTIGASAQVGRNGRYGQQAERALQLEDA